MAQERDRRAQADLHNERGIELTERGWLEEAALEFAKAIALDPLAPHPHENLATVLIRQKRWREALSEHLRAAELDPTCAEARFGLGAFLAAHALDLAADELREAGRIDPELPDVHLELGITLADLGQWDEARRELAAAAAASPEDPVAHHELGVLLMDHGDHRAAISHLREAVRIDPEAFEAHLDLGACYARKGFFAEAERSCLRARDLHPDDPVPHHELAAIYARWDRPADAEAALRRATELESQRGP